MSENIKLCTYLSSIGYKVNNNDSTDFNKIFLEGVNGDIVINLRDNNDFDIQCDNDREKKFLESNIKKLRYKNINEDTLKLNKKIINLINSCKETELYDFKKLYNKDKKHSFIKDILSLANNMKNEETYLIYGVSDEYVVEGVTKRIEQNNIIDLLDKVKFAGARPIIRVEHLNYQFLDIDVIVIEKSKNVPFYLEDDYNCSYEGKNHLVKRFEIFTRHQCKNSKANYDEVEQLWKYHFGYNESIEEKFKNNLYESDNWEYDNNHNYLYYKFDIDYKIVFDESFDYQSYYYYTLQMNTMDEKVKTYKCIMKYRDDEIDSQNYFSIGGYKFIFPMSEPNISDFSYSYFVEKEKNKNTYDLLYNAQIYDLDKSGSVSKELEEYSKKFLDNVLIFETQDEKDKFDKYLIDNEIDSKFLLEDSFGEYYINTNFLPDYYDSNQIKKDNIIFNRLKIILSNMRNNINKIL